MYNTINAVCSIFHITWEIRSALCDFPVIEDLWRNVIINFLLQANYVPCGTNIRKFIHKKAEGFR